MKALSAGAVEHVAHQAGTACESTNAFEYAWNPAICTHADCCASEPVPCTGACAYNADDGQVVTCADVETGTPHYQRLCPCHC